MLNDASAQPITAEDNVLNSIDKGLVDIQSYVFTLVKRAREQDASLINDTYIMLNLFNDCRYNHNKLKEFSKTMEKSDNKANPEDSSQHVLIADC